MQNEFHTFLFYFNSIKILQEWDVNSRLFKVNLEFSNFCFSIRFDDKKVQNEMKNWFETLFYIIKSVLSKEKKIVWSKFWRVIEEVKFKEEQCTSAN